MKGFFTQGFAILLQKPMAIEELQQLIPDEYSSKITEGDGSEMNRRGITLTLPELDEAIVTMDIMNKPWPDHMGSPDKEPDLFAAWSFGYYGTYTYPNSLERSIQFSKLGEKYTSLAKMHQSFIRIRTLYPKQDGNDPVVPEEYDSIEELMQLSRFLEDILNLLPEDAIYFNPAGERLLTIQHLTDLIDFCNSRSTYHLALWCNTRLYNLDENYMLMDSVGNEQADIADVEVIIPRDIPDLQVIANIINDVSMDNCDQILDVNNIYTAYDGSEWKIFESDKALTDPPRRTLRLFPNEIYPIPDSIFPKS